ncbi:hypothetical protein Ga0100231_010590 [Opitutaceae bacterium TAV4]|nr:hypothetical protein Ga0100231_010590 [Opitutaceae bacterium TAV4]RRJ98792.1 hypothetical protein Ga0100230_010695 [Opitutaceae bacterium TAV3]
MKSSTTPSFRKALAGLPAEIRRLARKNFKLWLYNPRHPSLHFKRIGRFWSARVGDDFRALAMVKGEVIEWFWIGSHAEYDRLLK